jgi:hypothetical protein
MVIAILFKIIFCSFLLNAERDSIEKGIPFQEGEKATYTVFYNWGFVWLTAADVEFSVSKKIYQERPVFRLFSTGTSLPSYDWFFPVRDTFVSYVDTSTLRPYFFHHNTSEGSYKVNNKLYFDYVSKIVTANLYNNKTGKSTIKIPIKNPPFDVLAAVYHCRTIDFDKLKEGQTVPIPTVIDDSVYNLYVRYKGKEQITIKTGRTFKTIKISAKLIDGTVFRGGEDLVVWLTDDKARVPVMVDAKILIGSVKAYLNTTENLKFPILSEIKE